VFVPSQEIELYLCVRGIDFACFCHVAMDFGTVPTVWYYFFFISLFLRDVDGLDIEDFVLCILGSEVMSLSIMIVISLKTLFRFRCSIFVNRIREKKKLERYLRSD
jgi:hypothetical protein